MCLRLPSGDSLNAEWGATAHPLTHSLRRPQVLNTKLGAHASFGVLRTKADQFCIKHFAGDVHYTVGGFLAKNKDALPTDAIALLSCSADAFTAQLFHVPTPSLPHTHPHTHPTTTPNTHTHTQTQMRARTPACAAPLWRAL